MTKSDELLAELGQLHPRLIDLSLGRTQRLLEVLDRPQDRLPPVIHVAGTNGKGSVVAYLKALLEAGDKRVHSFISPHLVRFHERIVLAGPQGSPKEAPKGSAQISEAFLVDVLTRAAQANDGEAITFFEITMVAAFLAFAETPADFLVLETGLGGRFDATNVIERPVLTIITPISHDHQDFLGERLGEIAFEKGGIMKPGVPCICARQPFEVMEVLRARAAELDVELIVEGEAFTAIKQLGRLVCRSDDQLLALPLPRLVGAHQINNAGLAIAAIQHLPGVALEQAQLEKAMQRVSWPARLQRLDPDRLDPDRLDKGRFAKSFALAPGTEFWLDGGHNRAAAEVLAAAIADLEEQAPRPLHLIIGMMRNKDAEGFLQVFEGLCEQVLAVPVPTRGDSWPPDELADIAQKYGMRAQACADVPGALAASTSISHELGGGPVRILICGSLYLAGHVLQAMQSA